MFFSFLSSFHLFLLFFSLLPFNTNFSFFYFFYIIVGEGTQHVLKVSVTGAPSDIFARDLGRFVTNSNLVKCAMAGCDPNVGRIIGKKKMFIFLIY